VLLLDLDPHASLTRAFAIPVDPPPAGSHDLFNRHHHDVGALAATPRSNDCSWSPHNRRWRRSNGAAPASRGSAWHSDARTAYAAQSLRPCPHRLPPTLGLLMVNAQAAADCLVVPTRPIRSRCTGWPTCCAPPTWSSVRAVARCRGRILPTLYDKRTRSGVQSLEQLRESHGSQVWPGVVPMDTRLRDANALALATEPGGRGFEAYARALAWLLGGDDRAQQEAA
jgi:chromosome partitioning protein